MDVRVESRRFVSFDGGVAARAEYLRPDRYRLVEADLGDRPRIARGGGYSYAAASFGAGSLVQDMTRFDRVLRFDPEVRLIEVEAGVTLGDLLGLTAPLGLWLPVQAGYPAITVGGCIAANVHGKNPAQAGTFVRWLADLTLFHPKHGTLRVSPARDPELFELTCGGYGLTGVILASTLRLDLLPGPRLSVRRVPVGTLGEGLEAVRARAGRGAFTYTWHDAAPSSRAFGRGIVYEGTFVPGPPASGIVPRVRLLTATTRARLPLSLWRGAARFFNAAFWRSEAARREPTEVSLFDSLFPFARRREYFLLFGRPGLVEYQALVPEDRAGDFLGALDHRLRESGAPGVLLSMKLFRGAPRLLRFESDGVCITLNLARDGATRRLLPHLDELTAAVGGIPNVIKDSRLPAAVVRHCYPEYEAARERLRAYDPARLFRSELSERLEL